MTDNKCSPGSVDARLEALMEIRRIANEPGDRRALVDRIYGIATEACRGHAQQPLGPCTQAEIDAWIETIDSKNSRLLLMWMDRALKAEEALKLPSTNSGGAA